MTSNSNRLKRAYFDWLSNEYTFTDISANVVEIGTTFLDNDFDYIVMYALIQPNGIILSDDGWTLDNLKSKGVANKRNHKHRAILNNIISSLGIEINGDDELFIETSLDKFPVAKQRLLQAILQVNDMIVLQDKKVKQIFYNDVLEIFKTQNILFTERPSFAGKNGITVQFDFSIPTHKQSEKLIRTITKGNDLNRAKLLTMDTQLLKNHKENVQYFALIDDEKYHFDKTSEVKTIFSENSTADIQLLTSSELISNIDLLRN